MVILIQCWQHELRRNVFFIIGTDEEDISLRDPCIFLIGSYADCLWTTRLHISVVICEQCLMMKRIVDNIVCIYLPDHMLVDFFHVDFST